MSKGISVNEIVTNRIIEELKKGVIPWRKPWSGQGNCINVVSRKSYSVLNEMLLSRPGEYMTHKQVQDNKGTLIENAKSDIIVFYKMNAYENKDKKDKDGKPRIDKIPCLRYYRVYHIDQTDIVSKLSKSEIENTKKFTDSSESGKMIKDYLIKYGIKLQDSYSDKACYSPTHDMIKMPLKKQFSQSSEYYNVLFHESVHSTGHTSRLKRLTITASFGSKEYSKEELVAEIGASILINKYNLETPNCFLNSVAYIQSWLRVLQGDSTMIVSASSKASKAIDLILNITTVENDAE